MLKISVEDFGPIIKGDIELKPLTIFLGPSNSGKSYMATVVYGLVNAIRQLSVFQFMRPSRTIHRRRPRYIGGHTLSADNDLSVLDELRDWLLELTQEQSQEVALSSVPPSFLNSVQSRLDEIITGMDEPLNDELSNSHGSVSDLIRRSSDPRILRVKLDSTEPPFSVGFVMSSGEDSLRIYEQSCDISNTKLDRRLLTYPILRRSSDQFGEQSDRLRRSILSDTLEETVSYTYSTLTRPIPTNSYYLPAARSGITQGHKVIASTMVRQSPFAGLRRMDIPTLPGVVTDFMSHMLTMETEPDRLRSDGSGDVSNLGEVIAFLEQNVLKGIIEIEQNTDTPYPEIYYEPLGGIGRFSFNRTSSMVSELAPVILFLKHIINYGDLLILEEPESHLHPASQQQMARAIVRLVNAGVKVIITTHSDLFLGAINNLMKLSFAGPSVLSELDRDKNDQLIPGDVAAYQFVMNDEKGGSEVKRLEIRSDVGIDEEEFAVVVEDLYDQSVLLQRSVSQ